LPFGDHHGSTGRLVHVSNGDGIMRGVHNDGGRGRHVLQLYPSSEVSLDAPHTRLDLRVALGLLHLLANFLLAHSQLPVVLTALAKPVDGTDDEEDEDALP